MYLQVFVWTYVFISLGYIYLKVGLLGRNGSSMLYILKNGQTGFLKILHPFTSSPATYESFNFSTSSPTLAIFCLFDYSHTSLCVVVAYHGFDCIFLMTNDIEYLSMCLLTIFSSWSNVCSDPLLFLPELFVLLIIELYNFLYVQNASSLSDT